MGVFDQTIRSFLDEAGSKAPTPGGGSVAGLSAALGASMGSMVANLSIGPKYEAVQERMSEAVEQMQHAVRGFESIVEQDMLVFGQYMAALGLPKASDVEKAVRSNAMQVAAKQSAEVPISLMRQCVGSMRMLAGIIEQVNKNVISDLAIALIMLEAAVQSAWITVEMNLPGLKDETLADSFKETGSALVLQSHQLKTDGLQAIRSTLG